MSDHDFNTKTVLELRKIAKELHVPLSAGISKAGIIERLEKAVATSEENAPAVPVVAAEAPAPAAPKAPEPVVPVATPVVQPAAPAPAPQPTPAGGQMQFRAAWHNPVSRYNSKSSYGPGQRSGAWQGGSRPLQQQDPVSHIGTVKPAGMTTRFGPQPQSRPDDEQRPGYRADPQPRQPYQQPLQAQPYQGRPFQLDQGTSYSDRPSYGDRNASYGDRPAYSQRTTYDRPESPVPDTASASLNELLASTDCVDSSGVLELHMDGYGFLRAATLMPSSKDIYVSMAQIKRFGLRNGDYVTGKTRAQREGDKYAAMLYITEINGITVDDTAPMRPLYDEMTPAYPNRRINLEAGKIGRYIDLIAPIGFGQRALILCPPETGKSEMLSALANEIVEGNPDAVVLTLLVDECPEDVTLFRETTKCQVLASMFDQAPDMHIRLADLTLERCERLVELGKDVVLIVDSLTKLSKIFTNSGLQQNRTALPGMINPTSLFRAKKIFGAARRTTEGGSLTTICAMNVDTGNKVDDSVVEEFRSTATTLLTFDPALVGSGLPAPINFMKSGTRRMELLSTPEQLECTKLLQQHVMKALPLAQAAQQIGVMIDKTKDNSELAKRLNDWVTMLQQKK